MRKFRIVFEDRIRMSRSSIDGVGMLMRRVTQSSFATAIAFAESEFELFLQFIESQSLAFLEESFSVS